MINIEYNHEENKFQKWYEGTKPVKVQCWVIDLNTNLNHTGLLDYRGCLAITINEVDVLNKDAQIMKQQLDKEKEKELNQKLTKEELKAKMHDKIKGMRDDRKNNDNKNNPSIEQMKTGNHC
jgi:hypothetical protein